MSPCGWNDNTLGKSRVTGGRVNSTQPQDRQVSGRWTCICGYWYARVCQCVAGLSMLTGTFVLLTLIMAKGKQWGKTRVWGVPFKALAFYYLLAWSAPTRLRRLPTDRRPPLATRKLATYFFNLSAKCNSNSSKKYEKYYVIFNTLKACGKAIFRWIAIAMLQIKRKKRKKASEKQEVKRRSCRRGRQQHQQIVATWAAQPHRGDFGFLIFFSSGHFSSIFTASPPFMCGSCFIINMANKLRFSSVSLARTNNFNKKIALS